MSDIGQEIETSEVKFIWKVPERDLPELDFESDMTLDDLIELEKVKK